MPGSQMIELGTCAIHGLVPTWRLHMTGRPEINTGPCCVACYIEWIKEHVPKVVDAHLVELPHQ